jgi:hypothetical protein
LDGAGHKSDQQEFVGRSAAAKERGGAAALGAGTGIIAFAHRQAIARAIGKFGGIGLDYIFKSIAAGHAGGRNARHINVSLPPRAGSVNIILRTAPPTKFVHLPE